MGGVGIYEANELEGDLRKRVEKLRKWLLEAIPEEKLAAFCAENGKKLHFDQALTKYVSSLMKDKIELGMWVEEKQTKLQEARETGQQTVASLRGARKRQSELETFIGKILVELPLEHFGRAKELLGLDPKEEPLKPTDANDAFREAMIRAQGHSHEALPHERSKIWISMMDAIARKQHAEAVERGISLGLKSYKLFEDIQKEDNESLKRGTEP